jgi:bacterioferritin-associated ferredoxin
MRRVNLINNDLRRLNSAMPNSALQKQTSAGASVQDQVIEAAVRQFMRTMDHAARRELEKHIRKAIADGRVKAGDSLTTGMGVSSRALDLDVTVYGKIEL